MQAHLHVPGPGMPGDIRQGLLQDPEYGDREILVGHHVLGLHADGALDARHLLELLALPFHGGGQPQVIEHAGPKVHVDPLDGLHGHIDQFLHGARPLQELLLLGGDLLVEQDDPRVERRQELAQLVVQLPGNPGPLLLANGLEMQGEIAQAPSRELELLLKLLAVGDVLVGDDDASLLEPLPDAGCADHALDVCSLLDAGRDTRWRRSSASAAWSRAAG